MTTGTLKQKMPWRQAFDLAQKIGKFLHPACQRINIAGSIRRRKPEVGDIEIICIPVFKTNLLGEDCGTELDDVLDRMVNERVLLYPTKNGQKQKQFPLPGGSALDLYIVDDQNWGMQLAVHTGPEFFSKALVTPKPYGVLPVGHVVRDGFRIMGPDSKYVSLPEEADVFQFMFGRYIEPRFRKWPYSQSIEEAQFEARKQKDSE